MVQHGEVDVKHLGNVDPSDGMEAADLNGGL